ncbi:protein-export membrane protein SecF [Candidatus Woesebacteria bacterium RBG_13_34_9]|uniref:Protein-export membrane protein SecF n=1 Tax=Candidatus Woesebacteria bacterium RBG_13_34_9 TaxID=1802477 RepID=A0A1F7X0H1_9BACT|nr:MAG: protein-export membrane protein SecF [Candidatus Woesebacteria bacterium RBG_13_34_9]
MDWMRFKKIYFSISFILLLVSAFSVFKFGLNLGLDFQGGSVSEYRFDTDISTEDLTNKLLSAGIKVSSIQAVGEKRYLIKTQSLSENDKEKLNGVINETFKDTNFEELLFETVGPSIGPELIKKTIYAITIASLSILLWVAYQFKSLKFGGSAILAMFHDTFNLIGIYCLLGHFFNAEIDFLFVTALLTTLSFSVHDTIVVYDRIRESQKKIGGSITQLANKAITDTMVRSLNNSFTIIFMLVAIILLGGTTIKWFAVALLIGTILGTYSSPFVAVPLVVTLEELAKIPQRLRRK